MKNLILLLVIVFGLTACSSPVKEKKEFPSSKIIKVDLKDAKTYKSSEVYDSIKYVRLETKNQNLLGDIRKIAKIKDHYYIQCNNGIFVFDQFGNYVVKIGTKGVEEGEYRIITDFLVDTLTNTIEILDRKSQKIIYYNSNGLVVDEWNYNLNAEAFYKINPETYIFYCSNLINIKNEQDPYRVLIVSKNTNSIIAKSMQIDDHLSNFISYADVNNFAFYDNSIVFTLSASDTVYEVNNVGAVPRYYFDFGDQKTPKEFFDSDYKDVSYFDRAFEKSGFAGLFNTFLFENDAYLITSVKQYTDRYFVIHSKLSKSTQVVRGVIDDMLLIGSRNTMDFAALPKGASGYELYTILEPSLIINTLDSLKKGMNEKAWEALMLQKPQLNELRKGLTILDNPVIQISRLKQLTKS